MATVTTGTRILTPNLGTACGQYSKAIFDTWSHLTGILDAVDYGGASTELLRAGFPTCPAGLAFLVGIELGYGFGG